MSDDARLVAIDRARRLLTLLTSLEPSPDGQRAVEECQYLVRAIEAFHMEAIRFRAFGLGRLITGPATIGGADARRILDEVGTALEAAGFHVRSH